MSNGYILLVEDSADDIDLTIRAFRRANVENRIEVARDGVEAIDFLLATGPHTGRDVHQVPMVVLLDLNLPRISGLEVLRRIREHAHTRLLPVVILTSSAEDRDRLEGYSLGANSYVRKPVDMLQFIDAVRQLGLYWLLLNEKPPTS
jgi:CheY-like chemotaxis protein